MKIAVIGPGTAREVNKLGWDLSFLPESTDPQAAIEAFAGILPNNESVIMACSDKSLRRMHGTVPADRLIEWEFYENRPRTRLEKQEADYLIFTSPSNAKAYLDIHALGTHQTAVAIGRSTDKALGGWGISSRIRAEHPTEESMWEAILGHRRDDN